MFLYMISFCMALGLGSVLLNSLQGSFSLEQIVIVDDGHC